MEWKAHLKPVENERLAGIAEEIKTLRMERRRIYDRAAKRLLRARGTA